MITQPVGVEQEAELWRAAAACPTKSIGNRDQLQEPAGIFPYRMTDGVFALEVWPESHWPGFALRQADVLQSYTA